MTSVSRVIRHVDAFTSKPLEGNPAAVVDGEGLDGEVMQRIALNQKLSETVFLLPPEDGANHARLRIFTPGVELPFAGHPTIAAAHILVSEGIVTLKEGEALRLETGAGLIPVAVSAAPPNYTMTQRAPSFRKSEVTNAAIASWVGLREEDIAGSTWVDTGFEWLIARVASIAAVERAAVNTAAIGKGEVSIFCTEAADPQASVRVRTFAPAAGIPEDPVTGSSNGCIAALIARDGLLPAADGELRYVAEQGIEMGQPGRVYLRVTGIPDALGVEVGGNAVTVLRGELLLG
jgi:PhzF family phenazine biosynthesis protein